MSSDLGPSRGKALALTLGAIVLLVVMIFLIAAVPSILAQAGLVPQGGSCSTSCAGQCSRS